MTETKNKEAIAPESAFSPALLKALHILTRDGKLNQDSNRKLKQVSHLIQLLRPHLEGVKTLVDLGAGKSYLGFLLYESCFKDMDDAELYSVETRADLLNTCRQVAQASRIERMKFVEGAIADMAKNTGLPDRVDAVTALHACDTATDDAIEFALNKQAKFIAIVPCCQAEVARLLATMDLSQCGEIKSLWRHPMHRREFGSQLTNVVRSLYLEAHGYKVRVTELVGWEHSLKNEAILAEKIQNSNPLAEKELAALLRRIPVPMKLLLNGRFFI